MATNIWNLAELGYKEGKSANLLQSMLKEEGFTIETGVAGIPTAFTATFGSGSPVIGVLGEYDALPGFSQDAVPFKRSWQVIQTAMPAVIICLDLPLQQQLLPLKTG